GRYGGCRRGARGGGWLRNGSCKLAASAFAFPPFRSHVVRYVFLFASHGRVLGNAGLASDFCFDRAGNEASFVCFVVRGPVFGVGWLLAGSESDCWAQDHFSHGQLVTGILRHYAPGFIAIA